MVQKNSFLISNQSKIVNILNIIETHNTVQCLDKQKNPITAEVNLTKKPI